MANINRPPQRGPAWPWGGPRSVRDRLINRQQLDGRVPFRKKGDPKNPSLASAALMDFIGPAHTSDELRFPLPTLPVGHGGDVEPLLTMPNLSAAIRRPAGEAVTAIEGAIASLDAEDRRTRMRGILARERAMLELLSQIEADMREVQRRRQDEQRDDGY